MLICKQILPVPTIDVEFEISLPIRTRHRTGLRIEECSFYKFDFTSTIYQNDCLFLRAVEDIVHGNRLRREIVIAIARDVIRRPGLDARDENRVA